MKVKVNKLNRTFPLGLSLFAATILCLDLIAPTTVQAELSDLGKLRIAQASAACQKVDNELTYKEYWGDSVMPENLETVCLAEMYSQLVADDGDIWLDVNSESLVVECVEQAQKDRNLYFMCLKQNLMEKAQDISSHCEELGAENLWDEDKCRRLVSYIFIKKFEDKMSQSDATDGSQASMEDLSMISSWRIRKSIEYCEQRNNELLYNEYWGSTVEAENMETVCIAEQFANLVATDANHWIDTKAVEMIDNCRSDHKKDEKAYSFCLQNNLMDVSKTISSPCAELGKQGLWDESSCRRLVSYIFLLEFEKVLEDNLPVLEKITAKLNKMNSKPVVRFLFNPISAILILIIFVLDYVLLVTPGDWAKVSKPSFVLGPLVLAACFLQDGYQFLFSLIVVVFSLLLILWNHNKDIFKTEKKDSNIRIIE